MRASNLIPAIISISLLLGGSFTLAQTTDNDLSVTCQQTDSMRLTCDYKIRGPGSLTSISAHAGDSHLPPPVHEIYPLQDDLTALLFLIDSSAESADRIAGPRSEHLKRIIESLKPHHRAGIVAFDSELQFISPIGTSQDSLVTAIDNLPATNTPTEFYRSVLEAVKIIQGFDADRRAVIVVSDGMAEDKAYHHDDVIKAATDSGTVIVGIGYARSEQDSAALQLIRRLAEETDGAYANAVPENYELPEEFLDHPYASVETGGHLTFDLGPLVADGQEGNVDLELQFGTGGKTISILSPIVLASQTGAVEVSDYVSTRPVDSPAVSYNHQTLNRWLWYGLPLAILALTALGIVAFRYWRNNHPPAKQNNEENTKIAYILLPGNSGQYSVTDTTCRIGRVRANNLMLPDNSVSREHAEIKRNRDGTFTLTDLNSLNGVYVNDMKIQTAILSEGDDIDIGDVRIKFTYNKIDNEFESTGSNSVVVQGNFS